MKNNFPLRYDPQQVQATMRSYPIFYHISKPHTKHVTHLPYLNYKQMHFHIGPAPSWMPSFLEISSEFCNDVMH